MYAGSVANRLRGEAAQCSATQSEAIRQVARGGVYSGVKATISGEKSVPHLPETLSISRGCRATRSDLLRN